MNLKKSLPQACQVGCFRKRDKDYLEIKAYKRLEKEVTITHILKQLRIFKKLTAERLGLESWRRAIERHGIKDYSLNFSSSEEEKIKQERKQRNSEKLANAFRKRLGLMNKVKV